MIKELQLQPKWFDDASPVNPKLASATLTFTGVVVAAETVKIGDVVFEFVADDENIAEETNIPVVIGEDLTSANAVAELADVINATLDNIIATVGKNAEEQDYCKIEFHKVGTEGNDITVSETCTNASFGADVTKLSGGQLGTPCPISDVVVYATPYYYWCEKAGSESTVVWKRFTPAAY